MSDNSPILIGKRRRAAISYAEPDDVLELQSDDEQEELSVQTDPDDNDDDGTYGSRSKTKTAPTKKKFKPSPKAKKEKPFRFLDLPPELRDMVYEMALTDVDGVAIVAKTKGYRRTAGRGPVYVSSSYDPPRWGRRRSRRWLRPDSKSAVRTETEFVPALLAVNKQINSEGTNYLYGQDFVFEETVALQQFLAIIGSQNQQRLSSVEILGWSKRGVSKAANYGAFTLLAGATNLQSLVLSCTLDQWTANVDTIARHFFKEAHPFLEAYGRANGDKDAVIEIIELDDDNYDPTNFYRTKPSSVEDGQAKFQSALRRFLHAS
ncbi:hypothetical protein MBLNU13_g02746t1 [Cladosporium sp. NU13]